MAPRYWDVCGADDADGGGVLQVKEEPGQKQGEKDAELCGCAKKHQPGLFQQGAKVNHGTNADKQQQGEKLVGHPGLKQGGDGAYGVPLGDGSGAGQVDQNGSKAHGQQQAGLHLFCNGQVDQQGTNGPHHHHLPGQVPKVGKKTAKGVQKVHACSLPPCAWVPGQEKRLLPQHSVCDKSLKPTHGIGHCCRDDAAMQRRTRSRTRCAALYSLLSGLLKQSPAASVKG